MDKFNQRRYARVLLSLNILHPATRLGKLNEMGLEIWSPSQPNKYGGVDSVNRVKEAAHIALDPVDFVPIAKKRRTSHLLIHMFQLTE
jgi:hypothetical protein|uniref:Uncharacterized protein n=1 Tax=Picea glauca TaxID=3330 RepID=A0A101M4Q6_PICGL|nr:hypothetical protein ABT39_MTgene755 [Picea glauca]QHR90473.1 hypothetical protein Q903MT_gene4497 [Picea sitchensis]